MVGTDGGNTRHSDSDVETAEDEEERGGGRERVGERESDRERVRE